MQLFSRNKALAALSLGALAALGACGDDVTVPVAPAAPVTVTISPSSANMNVGESLNFAVQISGGSPAPTLASCTSSNTAVATAAAQGGNACRVTAVAAGNATITAASSTGQVAAAAISVSAPAPAITSLAVSPSASQLAVGQSVTLVPTVQPAGRTATYSYATSAASVATVSATGVVTAAAPGVATITVTANAAAQGGFAAATINQAVTITVSDRTPGLTALNVQPAQVALATGATQALTASVAGPRASAATITYGTSAPSVATVSGTGVITAVSAGTAVITVTASATEQGSFAASSITALVPVTVSPNAQVAITSLTQERGSVVDLSNVRDQLEVNLAIQPNGQVVSEANVWVCLAGESVPACAARTNGVPAARQSFSAAGSQATNIQLYINTAEFETPNFVTGADANTLYKNGLRTIVATLTTSPAASSTIASNSISSVNFNNPDGWTIQWTAPANRANSAANITYYGGPHTPDPMVAGAQSGTGSFVVVPVVYTPNRTVVQATLAIAGCAGSTSSPGSTLTDTERPFGATYGTLARSTAQASLNFGCAGLATDIDGLAPQAAGGVDNNNTSYPSVTLTPGAGRSIFRDFVNISTVSTTGTSLGYLQSLAYRPNSLYLPHDYQAPTVNFFNVRGGGATSVDSGWVNASYQFDERDSDGFPVRYSITDNPSSGPGVGLFPAASRNTMFDICARPATISTTAATNCTAPVASGPLNSTVGSLNLAESADLTNQAYYAQARETDRLGNRRTTVAFGFTPSGGSCTFTATQTGGACANGSTGATFGVDLTAPTLVSIPNTGDLAPIAGFARTDVDSIFATAASGLNVAGQPTADDARFAVRFTDSRSGFPECVATNCVAGFGAGEVRGGSFQIARRQAPALASVSNDAQLNNLISGAANGAGLFTRQSINASVYSVDNSVRQFSIPVYSVTGRNNLATPPTNLGLPTAGYYTFSGTLVDRAGNTTAIPSRSVAIDNERPSISNIQGPAVYAGGTTVAFQPTGADDLEAISGDLALTYAHLGRPDFTTAVSLPTTLRFRRVNSFSTTAFLGLWHNPFASVTDNKLATPIGPGTMIGSAPLTLPIPFIQNLQVTQGGAPVSVATMNAATDLKPSNVDAYLYDIRATSTRPFTDEGRSLVRSATISGGQVPTVTTKNWGTTAVTGTTPAGIINWSAFQPQTGTLEFRATTSTSIVNPPFAQVQVIRANLARGEWEYLGTATYAGVLDQGGNRYFRYTFAYSGANQGQFNMAALGNGDVVRAIGVDASGNGLMTENATFGLANALPGSVTFGPFVLGTPAIGNSTANQDITLSIGSNPNTANVVFACTSSSSFVTATMISPTVCRIAPAGVYNSATAENVTISFTATGSAVGFNTNTLTATTTTAVTRTNAP